MKIRLGYVSNSSSASFIVRTKTSDGKSNLTNEQVKALQDYGFTLSDTPLNGIDQPSGYIYIYYVSINEDEVYDFLIDNNISFEALANYDNDYVIYTPETEMHQFFHARSKGMPLKREVNVRKAKLKRRLDRI